VAAAAVAADVQLFFLAVVSIRAPRLVAILSLVFSFREMCVSYSILALDRVYSGAEPILKCKKKENDMNYWD
jgi:hypothetical protein